jgi:hypothetical protein
LASRKNALSDTYTSTPDPSCVAAAAFCVQTRHDAYAE